MTAPILPDDHALSLPPEVAALPVAPVLPALVSALAAGGVAVLQAPPGAGKTTAVPLALLAADIPGRILVLEPRRLAARAAAERLAALRGETVGASVGYRMRGEAKTGPEVRIEVVTEGILTRMVQADPELADVGAVVFDEFHERALTADLGLALVWEARGALRPDLRIVVMSATLDAAPVAALLGDAPVITAEGVAFPVETRWRDRPLPAGTRWEVEASALILQAEAETRAPEGPGGAVLAFLPGEGEIRRIGAALGGRLPEGCPVLPLYGALPAAAQRAALTPSEGGARRVILATAIAETALTIPDVRVVVDAGRARRARFDPGSGMGRLVTERVTRAEADQRRGRAGRVAPGVCYRLWTKGEEGALAAFPPAEIEVADLAPLALELALWGARGAEGLAFLTPPPPGALAEARALLEELGALLPDGSVTAHGRALAGLPLHPRLGHMLLRAGAAAAPLAALLSARDPLRGAPCDLMLRRDALAGRRIAAGTVDPAALDRLRVEARRLERDLARAAGRRGGARGRVGPSAHSEDGQTDTPADHGLSWAAMAALAYPDRIGLRRPGNAPRWLLSGGKGSVMDPGDPLAGARLIVATDLDGDPREARIRQAALLGEADLRRLFADRIGWVEVCDWSARHRRVLARRQERLGALVLSDRPWPDPPAEALSRAALEGFRSLGPAACGLTPAALRLQARAEFLRSRGTALPDLSDAGLLAAAEAGADWLAAVVVGCRSEADLRALDLVPALQAALGWDGMAMLDRLAPGVFTTPLNRRVAIDYTPEGPTVALRLQEMFGTTTHPTVGPDRTALRLILLSPAGRPVQVTADLPGFWATSYADVRKDMRGQYPRHPWPEDPAAAPPTLRAKPRGG